MAKAILNTAWVDRQRERIADGLLVDETVSFVPAKQALVRLLATQGLSYRIIDLGAGVSRITTDDTVMPGKGKEYP